MTVRDESMQTQMRSLASRGARSRVLGAVVTLLAALALVVQGLAVPAAAAQANTLSSVRTATVFDDVPAGFGGFNILKLVGGDAHDVVREDTDFTVEIRYVLPRTADVYLGWQPPGILEEDKMSGSTSMTLKANDAVSFPGSFPAETRIILSEDTASIVPAPNGYTWGAPVFTIGDEQGPTGTLVIEDQKATAVLLVNTATLEPVPPDPQPTADPTSAPTSAPSSVTPSASPPASSPRPGSSLAATGAGILAPLMASGAALLGGGVLMRHRRHSGS